jgi:hypothetical protein
MEDRVGPLPLSRSEVLRIADAVPSVTAHRACSVLNEAMHELRALREIGDLSDAGGISDEHMASVTVGICEHVHIPLDEVRCSTRRNPSRRLRARSKVRLGRRMDAVTLTRPLASHGGRC